MNWDSFIYFALPSMVLWCAGGAVAQFGGDRARRFIAPMVLGGVVIFMLFIALLWLSLDRPPMRTMGETRLWYSLSLSVVGYLIFLRWRFSPILLYSGVMASIFVMVNLLRPDIHDQTLMPALQSIWFVPHVTIYMLAYGVMGVAFLMVLYISFRPSRNGALTPMIRELNDCGISLLIVGMLIGAIWAKEAWGNFWSWDAKESWALITAFIYLIYMHLRGRSTTTTSAQRWTLIAGFVALQICWYGVRFLPASQSSVHVYG